MRNVRLRRVVGIVGLVLVVLAGSVAGGYLFQATVGGPRIAAEEAQPVLTTPPPSLAALVKDVQGAVVAIGTKHPEKMPSAMGQQGQQFQFQMPGPGGQPDMREFFQQFFGEGAPEGEQGGTFRFKQQGDSDITVQTPNGQLHLFKDEQGQWWKETPDGAKEKWTGPDPLEMFGGGKAEAEQPERDLVQTVGSGVVISATGYIVTNSHVAKALPSDDIWVQFADDDAVQAKLVVMDEETDVAVLKVEAGRDLAFSQFGDSDATQIGDWVLAAGQPFGLQHSFTVGIVSARGRVLGRTYDDFLQTDAAIHPGNSGGPLYDMNGQIVGINTAIATSSPLAPIGQGIGFSIPSKVVDRISKQIIDKGEVVRGYIGVSLYSGVLEAKNRKTEYGAPIREVNPGGPAANGGLKAGDVIVSFNGQKVDDSELLIRLCAETAPGERVQVEYVRGGETLTATVEMAKRPSVKEIYQRIPGQGE